MSLLSVVRNAMAICSMPAPQQVFSNIDPSVTQMLALLYMQGRDLVKRHDWSVLQVTETLTCIAANAQTGYPVAAFDRMARGSQVWNTSKDWPIHGPVSADEWGDLIVRNAVTLPQYWRLLGGVLNIYAPTVGDGVRYEYISKYWIFNNGAPLGLAPSSLVTGAAESFISDSDTFLFPEELLELGLIWRWKQAKQLDYAEDMRNFEIALRNAIDSDKGGRRVIGTDRARLERPFKSWPGTITPVA